MRSFLRWLNRSPKLKSGEQPILRPVTPITTSQEVQLGQPTVSIGTSPSNGGKRGKFRLRNPVSSRKLQRSRQEAVARNERQHKSSPNSNTNTSSNPNVRHLPKWAFQLIPSRWLRSKRSHYEREHRECYASHTADRNMLEACVRYAEEDAYNRRRSRISTHFLLGSAQSPPPMLSETCIATPPFDSSALMEYGRAPSTSLESGGSCDIPRPIRNNLGLPLPLPSTLSQLPRISASSPPAAPTPSSPSRRRNTLVVLRSPHPPSSFALSPLNFNHSRQSSSQTQMQPRLSTCSSTVDHEAYKIGSFSNSSLGGRSSPLFYSAEDSMDAVTHSPTHGFTHATAHFQSQLPPIPSTPTTPVTPLARNFSAPASSGAYQTPKHYFEAPIGTPIARSGSLTISIHTENGKEDLEFPCPPSRWSGCWFAGKEPEFSNFPSQSLSEQGSGSRSGSQGSISEIDNAQSHFSFNSRARFPSSSTSSYGASLATPTTPTTPTTHTKGIPHMHTFGLGAASQLSLSAHKPTTLREAFQSHRGQRHVGVNASIDSAGDTSASSSSVSYGEVDCDGDISRDMHLDEEDIESMDSVCSAFLGVRMHHRGPSFDTPHALSDTDSVADPAFLRMCST